MVGLGKDSFSSFLAARYNNAFTLWLICKASFMSQLPGTLPQETAGLYLLLILHPCLLSAAWELVSPSQTTSYGWQTGELGRDWIPENFVKQSHDIRPRSLTTSLLHERKINFYLIWESHLNLHPNSQNQEERARSRHEWRKIGSKENTIPAFMISSLQTCSRERESTTPVLWKHYEVKKKKGSSYRVFTFLLPCFLS